MEDNYTKLPASQEDDSTKYPAGLSPATPTIPAAPARKRRSWMTVALMLLCLLFLAGLAFQTWRLTELEDGRATSTSPEFTSTDATVAYITEQDIRIYELKETVKALEAEKAALTAELNSAAVELYATKESLRASQATFAEFEQELDEKQAELAGKQSELDQAYIILGQKMDELCTSEIALDAAKLELGNQKQAFALQTQQLGSMVGVKAEIIQEVSSALYYRGVDADVDPATGDIIINSSDLRFETNKAELTADSMQFLQRFIPVYLEVLMRPEYADYIGSIVIEGHTDRTGSYERNMELSQERALEVLLYIRSMYAHDQATLSRLDKLLVATGKGSSDPIKNVYNGIEFIDDNASRRVEFKFSLRDAEMIEEINKLLNGD